MNHIVRCLAVQNDVDPFDLEYAVKTIQYGRENKLIESTIYEELIISNSHDMWKLANEVLKNIGGDQK